MGTHSPLGDRHMHTLSPTMHRRGTFVEGAIPSTTCILAGCERDMCCVYMKHGAIPVGPSHSPQTRTCARARAACRREVRQQPCVLGRSDSSRVCWEVRQLQHTDVCARATRQEGQQTHVRPDRRASTHTCDQTGVAPDSSNSSAMSVCRGLVLSVCPMMCDCTRGVPMVLRRCV